MTDLVVRTHARVELVDITDEVARLVAQSGVRMGLCNLFVTHTTAAVIVSENWDPDVTSDLLRQLERMVPRDGGYRHAEGNAQAHILSVMLGTSVNLPVREARLALGRWQGVMLAEFDGPRERMVVVSVAPLGQ
ncbi:MAG TPA: secondary thiamine-phosphate synthase enzyme YjbQ [Candidatus Binataceae bacterium]|nr:secondary thiamine-phosphate synthase enzyme YjbQ [Candidatus Binataceae bacterium]